MKEAPGGMAMGAQGGRLFVADVFDEEEDEDVVFVLGGVHAAAELLENRYFLIFGRCLR